MTAPKTGTVSTIDNTRRQAEQGAAPYTLDKGPGRLTLTQHLAGEQSCLTIDRAGSGVAMMLSQKEMLLFAHHLLAHARTRKPR